MGRRSAVSIAVVAVVALVLVLSLGSGSAGAGPHANRLTIFAASSLADAFGSFDRVQRYSFAGSNVLETQIRNSAPADLFASAAPLNAQRLYRQGLVEKPVTFASNRLALIVPKANPAGIRSVYDLRRKPVKLVVANPAVPAGAYTRTVLRRLGLSSVLSKVVSEETDVRAVTGKVALGQADAGFVYLTDAHAVRKQVAIIAIPARAQPPIRYQIAVVSSSSRKLEARAWIRQILSARGQAALEAYGFLPPPNAS
jgi:molybdate transport system substrate-binding protein